MQDCPSKRRVGWRVEKRARFYARAERFGAGSEGIKGGVGAFDGMSRLLLWAATERAGLVVGSVRAAGRVNVARAGMMRMVMQVVMTVVRTRGSVLAMGTFMIMVKKETRAWSRTSGLKE